MTIQLNRKYAGFDEFLQDMNRTSSEGDSSCGCGDEPALPDLFANQGYDPGTRVAFIATLESMLTYNHAPDHGKKGIVVRVYQKLASSDNDQTWVKWDDGSFGCYRSAHLKASTKDRTAFNISFRTTSIGEDYTMHTASTLIHKAKKDLWAFRKEGEEYVIERLFDETGEPIKV
jgi:hypothetical protein